MNKQYYNTVSDSNLQRGGYLPEKIAFFEKEIQQYKDAVAHDLEILDVACNDGGQGQAFLKYGTVYGVDLNQEAVAKAKANGIQAIVSDVYDIDKALSGKKFDVVIAGDIIEHLFDTDLFLRKIQTTIKDGGMLLLTTPNLVSLGRRLMSMAGRNPFCEYSSKKDGFNVGHIRYYTLANLQTQLQENNFKEISIQTDTMNLPLKFLNKLVWLFPGLGRELMAKAFK